MKIFRTERPADGNRPVPAHRAILIVPNEFSMVGTIFVPTMLNLLGTIFMEGVPMSDILEFLRTEGVSERIL